MDKGDESDTLTVIPAKAGIYGWYGYRRRATTVPAMRSGMERRSP